MSFIQVEKPRDHVTLVTLGNFEEKIAAWKEGRTPVYTDE